MILLSSNLRLVGIQCDFNILNDNIYIIVNFGKFTFSLSRLHVKIFVLDVITIIMIMIRCI